MSADEELETAYNEVLKKIGRNLLLFQQAEGLIKRLAALGSLSSRAGESLREFEHRASFCHKMTMGQVANLFMDSISTLQPSAADSPFAATAHTHPGTLSISVHLQLDIGVDPEERRQSFDRLVAQRNELVHHLFSRIDPSSAGSCASISAELDEQRRQILPDIQRLQQDLRNTRMGLQNLFEFLDTPEGKAELYLPEIQQSQLITNLAAIAAEHPDPKAWTPLGTATKRLQDFPREKIDSLVKQFGLKSLTEFLTASERFELQVEQLKGGKHRVLYRVKSVTPPPPVRSHDALP